MDCPICASPSALGSPHPEVELYCCPDCGHRFSKIKPGFSIERYGEDYFEETHRNWFAHPNVALFKRIAWLIEHEPSPKSVIDVGCGNGNLLQYLVARCNLPITLTGLDLVANSSTPEIEYISGDVIDLDLNRQFSTVVTLATIEHIPDIRRFAQRLHALAKPGGKVVVMTLNDDSVLYMVARLLRWAGFAHAFNRLYSRHHLHHFTRRSLSALLAIEGLHPVSEILHNAPLSSIDIPASSRASAFVLRIAVAVIFLAGTLTRRTYLQTIVCRRD